MEISAGCVSHSSRSSLRRSGRRRGTKDGTICACRPSSRRRRHEKAYSMLHSIIVGWLSKNRPPRLIMETESRDGREVLRKLDAEYRPTCRGKQMALLKQIMHPHLNSRLRCRIHGQTVTVAENSTNEGISGQDELDQLVKTATLVEEAPTQLQEHLTSHSEEIGTDYKKVIWLASVCVSSRRVVC